MEPPAPGTRLATLLMALSFGLPVASADTYWVSSDGQSEWSACRSVAPLSGTAACSLPVANQNALAGDTVMFREGVYLSQQINPQHSGSSGARLVFRSYSDEAVELNGQDSGCGIYINGKDYITIDGFYVHDWRKGFVLYDGAEYNIIQNCEFLEFDAYTGSEIVHYCVNAQGLDCHNDHTVYGQPCSYNKILNNRFPDAPDDDNCKTEAYCESQPQADCNTSDGCWWVRTGGARTGWVDGADTCTRYCGSAPDDGLEISSGAGNLVEGNYFGNHAHSPFVIRGNWVPDYQRAYIELPLGNLMTHHNVVRNNRFENGYRRAGATTYLGAWMLWEDNQMFDTCNEQPNNPLGPSRNQDIAYAASGVQLAGTGHPDHVIFRRNVLDHNGNVIAGGRKHMRIYHNTAYRLYRALVAESGDWTDNVVKNNIFAGMGNMIHPTQMHQAHIYMFPQGVDCDQAVNQDDCNNYDIHYGCVWEDNACREQYLQGNDFSHNTFHPDTQYWRYRWIRQVPYADFESQVADFHDNLIEDPEFVDANARDFRLSDGSGMIDAADMLTTVTAVGGDVITVQDAGYFYDGWGIPDEQGDMVYTGDGSSARILGIDYDNNIITLDSAGGFAVGDSITTVQFIGARPDIGAFEYDDGSSVAPAPPANLRVR